MPTNAEHQEVEKDQYTKIENLTKTVSELTGAVSVLNKTNTDLIALLKKALSYEFYIILILIATIIYGAIGKDGLYSVRQVMPMPTSAPHSDGGGGEGGGATAAILFPWHDDRRVSCRV